MLLSDVDKTTIDNFKKSPLVIENYVLFQSAGVFQLLQSMSTELNDLDELLNEASVLFNKQSIQSLTDYICEKIVNKFVPSYMAFIFHENIGSDHPEILCFKNMRPVDPLIQIKSIEPYKHFFSLSPTSVDFKVFEYMVGKPNLTEVFLPLNPAKVIPILGFDGVHGFIVVGKKVLDEDFSAQETNYLDRLIQFASISFRNNIHYKRAITDFKTRLYNHSYFVIRLEEEMARLKRYRSEISLIMIDVDHFKKLNDTHGHLAGDKVLSVLAQSFSNLVRTEDVAARFGGEEFVIMLIQCNLNFAKQVAERIRLAVESLSVEFEGKQLSVTISLGIAHTSHEGTVPDSATLLSQADAALYHSKSEGRNQSTVYEPTFKSKEN